MKAVRLHGYGGVDELKYEDVETPKPKADEVLIKVAASSINPIDWKLRSGAAQSYMPLTLPAILGFDVSGTVIEAGTNVRNPQIGQKVMGLASQSHAEYVAVPAQHLTVIPDGVELENAGALPLVVTTGAQLIHRIQPKPGDLILITGAIGSVGRAAVYTAIVMGARVIAGVRSSQMEKAQSLGVDRVIAVDNDEELAALAELDAIADTVGHELAGKLLPKLKRGGTLGSVFYGPVERKDIRVEAFTAQPDASLLRNMVDAVRDGKLEIPIAKRLSMREAGDAQLLAERGSVSGKILLIP
jgi:NADPH:quinone reductase-like Zn-dependent oxidoreductase